MLTRFIKKTSKYSNAIGDYFFLQSFFPFIFNQDIWRKHLVIKYSILLDQKKIWTQTLINIGASSYAFISYTFEETLNLPLTPLFSFIILETFEDWPVISDSLNYKKTFDIFIDSHSERIPLFITWLSHYLIVLRISMLQRYNYYIKFFTNFLVFNSFLYINHCLPDTKLHYILIQKILKITIQSKAFIFTAILDLLLSSLSTLYFFKTYHQNSTYI